LLGYYIYANIKGGVAYGDAVQEIFKLAKKGNFALPAVNVTGSNTINTVLETAKEVNSPVIIQLSNGGCHFNAGKGLNNDHQQAAIAGGIAGVRFIRRTNYRKHRNLQILPQKDG